MQEFEEIMKLNKYQKQWLEMVSGQRVVLNTRRWSGKRALYDWQKYLNDMGLI